MTKDWIIHENIGAKCHDEGNAEGAAEAYYKAALSDEYLRSQRTHYSNYLFALHYLNGINNEDLAREHFVYGNLYKDVKRLQIAYNYDKLTIGYIATEFVESSTARFYESLLTEHSDEFTVKVFSLKNTSDEFTERIKRHVDKYIELTEISIEESANLIASERINILFDLSGHADGGMTLQILGYKPAPIQIVGIGWFDTTGLSAIDYILTDNYLAPIGHEKYFSEKLLRLNNAFAFKPTEAMLHCNIKHNNRHLTFGSYNNFMKVTDNYLRLVKRILNRFESSKFIMQDTTQIMERKIEMERRIKQLKLPAEKIEIRLGNVNYFNDYADIDIMLDTYPYNGGFMTAMALFMNVPVVSLYGERHSSRFSADILRIAGLSELIAMNENEYFKIAVDLANDSEKLKILHQTLKKRVSKSKLFDMKRFVAEIEQFYKNFCNKKLTLI